MSFAPLYNSALTTGSLLSGSLAAGVAGIAGAGVAGPGGTPDAGTPAEGGGDSYAPYRETHAFEHVFATLRPFQYPTDVTPSHPMAPIIQSGGLAFPYNPSISEGVSVGYDNIDLTHSNESYYAYKNTDNVRIGLSDAKWTCDTFDNAIYALAVLHFFRSYSFMDFGRFKTGRPPSPMWFSAYGRWMYNRVPCFMEKADWSFPIDVDYVGIPDFGTEEYRSKILVTDRNAKGKYTWMPVVFTVSSISLIVQHAPSYWVNWSLDDYWSGKMLERDGDFHQIGPEPTFGAAARSPGAVRAAIKGRGLPGDF